MPDQQQIPAMNEVAAALDAGKTFTDRGASLADEVDVRLAQNTADTVHVVLPCYASFDTSYSDLTDEQLQAISGGEIIVTILFAIGGAAVTGQL